jgi:hypothetical protein
MDFKKKDKRTNERTGLAVPIDYTLPGSEADKSKYYFEGTTSDISDSGVGFYTNMPLHKGMGINILSEYLWSEPKSGTVRWCKTLSFNHYFVGVSL